mmetsp:Transcript_12802/g.31142  ORF Transcript_12802/g.31142 Transcript_12802/m.31142 type:complete len:262 (-) Transcript_12802:147-932(-)
MGRGVRGTQELPHLLPLYDVALARVPLRDGDYGALLLPAGPQTQAHGGGGAHAGGVLVYPGLLGLNRRRDPPIMARVPSSHGADNNRVVQQPHAGTGSQEKGQGVHESLGPRVVQERSNGPRRRQEPVQLGLLALPDAAAALRRRPYFRHPSARVHTRSRGGGIGAVRSAERGAGRGEGACRLHAVRHPIGPARGTTGDGRASRVTLRYRGTSLIRNRPFLGPYSRVMRRALWSYTVLSAWRRVVQKVVSRGDGSASVSRK